MRRVRGAWRCGAGWRRREGRLRCDLEGVGATEVAGVVAGGGEEEREHVEVAHDLAEVSLGGEQEGLVHDLLR
eukprot:scaffold113682_cov21-Phaeocystis_antarctica.AAC.1